MGLEGYKMSESKGKRDRIVYTNKYGFTLCQQNGQRTYGGPPPNWGSRPPPSRDCEVFIGRLPRMCFEDELIPLFLTAGELYEFRLMLDFSGTNRGYGYAHYATPAGAAKAIEKLNKYEIRPGHQIGVLKSKNNCRLLFGNIGSALDVNAFSEFIRSATDQVLNVLMFKSFQQLKATDFRISSEVEEAFLGRVPRNNGNNQFAIVEYENHKAAAVARRVLIPKYGHILAIDWAVPPRERKRFGVVGETQIQAVERPFASIVTKDSGALCSSKLGSKIRPVPVLLVHPSPLDNVSFMPKTFKAVVKFFKYQLSVCLYKSVDQLEIPLFICKEIERKIVDRITNLENCSQAVQLIFNYFSWYNEKKRFVINSEVQKLLQEVKTYSDSFVHFVNKRLKCGPSQNAAGDNYYINVLPLQLNVLFRIILRTDGEMQAKLSSGITKGLKWLVEVAEKGDKASKEFIDEVIDLTLCEDADALDQASTVAKSLFLSSVTTLQQPQSLVGNLTVDLPSRKNLQLKHFGNGIEMPRGLENRGLFEGEQMSLCLDKLHLSLQRMSRSEQHLKIDDSVFSSFGKCEGSNLDPNAYPPVPLLLVQPSILNNVPFMSKTFNNVLTYFKHLIRLCLNANAWQMNIPQQVCTEIERKIIDRISNMENCGEGVELILNYLSWWMEKRLCNVNMEVQKLLHEVKIYSDAFVSFTWNKTMSGYQPNPAMEHYFCNLLPLRLTLLFQMMLIFNSENPRRFLIGISKGLNWLEELFQRGDSTAKEFLEELTRFVLELDPASYDKAKNLGKIFCAELMSTNGRPLYYPGLAHPFGAEGKTNENSYSASSIGSLTPNGLSTAGSENTSESASEYDP